MTRDIKQSIVDRLSFIQSGLTEGTEQYYQMSDVIDSLLSSMVAVTYTRDDSPLPLPGAVESASELYARNID